MPTGQLLFYLFLLCASVLWVVAACVGAHGLWQLCPVVRAEMRETQGLRRLAAAWPVAVCHCAPVGVVVLAALTMVLPLAKALGLPLVWVLWTVLGTWLALLAPYQLLKWSRCEVAVQRPGLARFRRHKRRWAAVALVWFFGVITPAAIQVQACKVRNLFVTVNANLSSTT